MHIFIYIFSYIVLKYSRIMIYPHMILKQCSKVDHFVDSNVIKLLNKIFLVMIIFLI